MAQTASATDVQPPNHDQLDGSSCVAYAGDRAREYAATVRFIGLLAGVGDDADVAAARQSVRDVLTGIGINQDEAAARREATDLSREWYRLKYETPTSDMTPQQLASHEQRLAEIDDSLNNNIAVQNNSPSGVARRLGQFFSNLWGSFTSLYNNAIASIRDGTWKTALCRLGVDAGFAIVETGIAAALTAIGLGAAAAFLKIVSKIAAAGSKMVRIAVRAERNLVGRGIGNPNNRNAERNFHRPIDTDNELRGDERRILGEENQGNTDGSPTEDRGEANTDGGGETPPRDRRWQQRDVNGRRVYQRDDLIDPNYVDPATGQTNLQRMQAGRPPLGPDGEQLELHHMLQQEGLPFDNAMAPLAEVGKSFHSRNYNAIHIYRRNDPEYISWRRLNPDNARRYDNYRRNYWKARAQDFAPD